tara:strand:- start:356 stop:856 length:501 start_codon:yes stop_codon:yes gene_type:complete
MSGIIDTVGARSGVVGSDVYPAGHILQVKSHSSSTSRTFSPGNTSFGEGYSGNADFEVGITPTHTNSKFLILADITVQLTDAYSYGAMTLVHNGGNLGDSSWGFAISRDSVGSHNVLSASYLHTPTIPDPPIEIIYGMYFKLQTAGSMYLSVESSTSTITVLEIKG